MRAGLRVCGADPLQLDLFAPPVRREAAPAPAAVRAPEVDASPVLPSPPPPALAALEPPSVGPESVSPEPPSPEPARNARSYRITAADRLGEGSLRAKCAANLAAVEVLRRIEAERREAMEDEKRALVRYAGWGGLPQVFDGGNLKWRDEARLLRDLLADDEYASARATTLNAHYTPPLVIGAVYALLERLGFTGGRILEPACGIGHFLGLMPEAMRRRAAITGIEIDGLSARIAHVLYPDADLRHQPFEEAVLADGFYDVAVSNVPFGDYQPFDPRFNAWHLPIHDWFFAAALAKVRPGGLVAFITSRGTLDKADPSARELLDGTADFVGAVRLPNSAFKANAHTEVTTDLVVLRKRGVGEPRGGPAWRELVPITNSRGETIPVNEWYAARPELMLGEMRLAGRMYRHGEPTLAATHADLGEALNRAIAHFPAGVYRPVERPPPATSPVSIPFSAAEVKPNAFTLVNGSLARRERDGLVLLTNLPATTAQRLRGLVRVRDALRRCLATQREDRPEDEITASRLALNQAYDAFVSRHGPLSAPRNVAVFRGDPDLPLLLSLEHLDRTTGRAAKAAVFRERTLAPRTPPATAADAKSALLVTLNERGRVDLDHLARLLRRPPEQFLPEMAGLVYLDPVTRGWETDDAYLSGDVKAKLRAAQAAALVDPSFAKNVEALAAVQPADLAPAELDARLGSSWLPPEDIARFAEELLGGEDGSGVEVRHAPVLGTWVVVARAGVRTSVANTAEWGTDRRGAVELLEDALNLRVPTIYDRDPQDADRLILNPAATEAARDRQQRLKEKFQAWVWQDDGRRERLGRLYNDRFNCLRTRTYNGDHLDLPGASTAVTLRPHQKAAVWRILQTPNTLLAHVVGAGKTYTMVAAAMELRRLGLARKPLFAVPNHMLEQFSRELLTLYPAAHLLVATQDDFEKQRRQTLMSRIATGNWDAVIVTHSGFERLPVSVTTQEAFFTEQIEALSDAILEQKRHDDRGSRIVKELERAKKRLETRLKELLAAGRKDDGLTFEELGVDRLFVDEAHHFKNLFYVTKMTRVAGLPQTASQRALDLYLKVRHVQRMNGGGGVVFATGTPVANSVAELYTMQRYLQPGALAGLGVAHFDAWAGTFGEPVTALELSPDGAGYRLHTRFARFLNVPELLACFREAADIRTAAMLDLPVPRLRTGKPVVLSAPASPELKEIVRGLVARAEAIRRGGVMPRDDNMLLVTTDGRKAALDLRVLDASLPDHPDSKVNLAAHEIARIWAETKAERLTQLVFCDLSTPGPGFNVYADLRSKLMAKGVPPAEIAFIQDAATDAAKAALFADVRAGRVRVLLGSTAKMGSGTNVQERLIALHHLDAPWRPADVEQREGRLLRQGNTNAEVSIHRYVTAGSFDAYMWQVLETKARFIAQVMAGDTSLRRLEDVDGAALTYAEVKAIASGNPLVIEKATVDAELARLTRLRSQHFGAQHGLLREARHLREEVPRSERRITALEADLSARVDTRGDRFALDLGADTLTDRGIAGELLLRAAQRLHGTRQERRLGRFAGFDLWAADLFTGEVMLQLKGAAVHTARLQPTALGTTRALEHVANTLEDTLAVARDNLAHARKRLADLEAQAAQPFPYAEKLASLQQRQQELAAALDLTRPQGAAALPSDLPEPPPPPDDTAAQDGDWSW